MATLAPPLIDSAAEAEATAKTRFCFLHMPKCAGASIIDLMRTALGKESVLHVSDNRRLHSPLGEFLFAKHRAIAGHFMMWQLTPSILEKIFVFTFLRDPIERVLSQYFYYRNVVPRGHVDRDVGITKKMELPALLQSCDPGEFSAWSNWQTFALGDNRHSGSKPDEVLRRAKLNLTRLDFVGSYEELDKSVRRLGQLCGWDPEIALPKLNVTPDRKSRDEIDPEIKERIRDLNRLDIELCEYARTLLDDLSESKHPRVPAAPTSTQLIEGSREVEIKNVQVQGARSGSTSVEVGEAIVISILGRSKIDCPDLIAGILFTDDLGMEIYGTNNRLLSHRISVQAKQSFAVTFRLDLNLAPGMYQLTVAFTVEEDQRAKRLHWIDNFCDIECRATTELHFSGLVDLKAEVKIATEKEE